MPRATARPPGRRGQRIALAAALGPMLVAVLAGLVVLWPHAAHRAVPRYFLGADGKPLTLVDATVDDASRGPCGQTAAAADHVTAPDQGFPDRPWPVRRAFPHSSDSYRYDRRR